MRYKRNEAFRDYYKVFGALAFSQSDYSLK